MGLLNTSTHFRPIHDLLSHLVIIQRLQSETVVLYKARQNERNTQNNLTADKSLVLVLSLAHSCTLFCLDQSGSCLNVVM